MTPAPNNPIEGWTINQLYNLLRPNLPLIPNLTRGILPTVKKRYPHRWSEPFADLLRAETDFTPIEDRPLLTAEQVAAVENQQTCPVCNGRQEVLVLSRGVTTGMVVNYPYLCKCAIHVKVACKWNDNRQVPRDFRSVRLSTLEPIPGITSSVPLQADIIKTVQANPHGSFFLFGPPGSGKTHIATALYRTSVEGWARQWYALDGKRDAVWRTSTSVLLEETARWDNKSASDRPVDKPVVIIEEIQRAFTDGYHVALFLDEIDKISPTDYKLNKLFQLVDLVWSNGGQLVATANKGMFDLSARWGADIAGSIIRRIADPKRGAALFFGQQRAPEKAIEA
jgi:hypothetical protein